MLLSFAVFVLSTKPSEFVDELGKTGIFPTVRLHCDLSIPDHPADDGNDEYYHGCPAQPRTGDRRKFENPWEAFLPLISPVVMSSLINTRERAIALEVRGFGAGKKKTWLTERTRHKGDREITIFLGVCILAAVVWRIVGCL